MVGKSSAVAVAMEEKRLPASKTSVKRSFPKSVRLLKRRQYEKLGRSGERLVGKKLVIEALSVSDNGTRLGITVTKKYGKAHDRNRFKRCVREAFRQAYPSLPKGVWLNVRPHAKKQTKEVEISSSVIQDELIRMLC